jgi:trans-aconitate methyltransferase
MPSPKNSYDEMIRIGEFNQYHNLLDIGCGTCSDLLQVEKNYGIKMFGFDRNREAIKSAQKLRPDLRIKYADAEEQNYPDRMFDGIMLKQVLSEVNNQKEVLYLANCALSSSGLIFLADFYLKQEDIDVIEESKKLAEIAELDAIINGNCETRKLKRPSKYCVGRSFIKSEFLRLIYQVGLKVVQWYDAQNWLEARNLNEYESYFFVVLRKYTTS